MMVSWIVEYFDEVSCYWEEYIGTFDYQEALKHYNKLVEKNRESVRLSKLEVLREYDIDFKKEYTKENPEC